MYREHYDENGKLLKKELISEDFYPPVHQIEIQGLIEKAEASLSNEGANDLEEPDGNLKDSASPENGGNDSDLENADSTQNEVDSTDSNQKNSTKSEENPSNSETKQN